MATAVALPESYFLIWVRWPWPSYVYSTSLYRPVQSVVLWQARVTRPCASYSKAQPFHFWVRPAASNATVPQDGLHETS